MTRAFSIATLAVIAGVGCDRQPSTPAPTSSQAPTGEPAATPPTATPPIATPPIATPPGSTPPGSTPPGAELPPVELSRGAQSGVSADGTYTVRWEVVGGAIPDAEPFSIAFAVTRADGKPVSPEAKVFVDAEMPHHGHGMNFVPTVKRKGGDTFVGEGLLFHMPGRWVLAIDIGEDGVRERVQWNVDVE
jgi:hypothetical protein